MERTSMTISEFQAALKAQGVSAKEHFSFICPICGSVQSAADLIRAGAGKEFSDVEKYIAFSCVGRFTDAGPYRKGHGGKGCDWTLGGLLQLHTLEVMDEDGKRHPMFAPASPEQAMEHEKRAALGVA